VAFNFDRSSSQYFQVDQTPVSGVPITISCFFKPASDTVGGSVCNLVDASTSNNMFSMLIAGNLGGDPVRAFVQTPGGTLGANSTTGYTTGTWHHGAVVFESSTIAHAYIDGGSKGSTTGTARIPTGIDRVAIGRHGDNPSPGAYYDGDLCEIGIWNAILTDSEIAGLAEKFSPLFIRRNNLIFYTSMIDTFGGNLNDMIGGLQLAPFNSPTKSEHFRIIMPHHLKIGFSPEIPIASDNITLFLQAQNDINDNINLYLEGHRIFPHRKIYFHDHNYPCICKSDLDGSLFEEIIDLGADTSQGLDIDHTSKRKLYYSLVAADNIKRADLDGTNQEVLVTSSSGVDGPRSLTFNATIDRIYWSEAFDVDIHYADSDGENVVDTNVDAIFTTVDLTRNKLYSIDISPGTIRRCDLDGSSVETIATGLGTALKGIYYHTKTDKIYWCDSSNGKIQTSGLNGGSVEDLVTSGLSSPWGLYIDSIAEKIYFTDVGNNNIQKCNLDGSDIEEIIPSGSLSFPYEIAVDHYLPSIRMITYGHVNLNDNILLYLQAPEQNVDEIVLFIDGHQPIDDNILLTINSHEVQNNSIALFIKSHERISSKRLFYSDAGSTYDEIRSISTDGGDEYVLVDGLTIPRGVAVNPKENRVYFTDFSNNTIQGVNFDGTNLETIISGLSQPAGIDVDYISNPNKIYFTEFTTNLVKRANLDGSDEETLVDSSSGVSAAFHLTLDLNNNKIYWVNVNTDIQKSDLDGNNVETIVSSGNPYDISIDNIGQKLYWTENSPSQIKRSNLDGSSPETFVTYGSLIRGLHFDSENKYIYSGDDNNDEIFRVDQNGNVTNILSIGGVSSFGDIDVGIQPVNLFVHGHQNINDNILLFINGHGIVNSDITLYINSFDSTANSISLHTNGFDIHNEDITLFLRVPQQISNDINLFMEGHETSNNNIELFINGFQPTTDNIPLSLVGHADFNNNIDLFINSHQQITNSIDLFISSFDQITDNVPLFIWGHDRVLHQKLYTLDSANGDILISDIDGNFLGILLENEFNNALGIDVDQVNRKIYWTENINNNISRANLDGTSAEIIVPTASGINSPGAISIHPILNRIYWIDDNGNNLKRANLDGTDVETLI
jgi:hypothetical protein